MHYQFFFVLTVLASAVKSEVLNASNVQICTNICSGCGGTATFNNDVCDCRIPDNNENGTECIKHVIKQQNDYFNLDSIPDQENSNRETRCSPTKLKKRMRAGDIDRVVNYFVNSGPMTGMPLLGNAKSDCPTSETVNKADNKAKPEKKINSASEKRPIARKNEENIPPKKNNSPMDSSAKVPEQRQNAFAAAPHLLESRSLHHHHHHGRLLGAIPSILLEIPQAIASAVVPRYPRVRYTPLLGVPQNTHLLGSAQYPYLLGSVAVEPHEIIQNNNAVPAYIPASDQGSMVPQMQPANPHVGIPNTLLAGVERLPSYPGLYRATHYSPVLGAIAPQPANVIDDNANVDDKLTQSEASLSPQLVARIEEKPTALHEALAQQNAILETLNEQLKKYAQVGLPNYQYSPVPYNTVGAPNPMQQCYCNDRGSAMVGTSRRLLRVRKPNTEAEAAPMLQPKATEASESTEDTWKNKITEENINAKRNVVVARSSRQSTVKEDDCDWQCVAKYLDKIKEEAHSPYRVKRANVKYAKSSNEMPPGAL